MDAKGKAPRTSKGKKPSAKGGRSGSGRASAGGRKRRATPRPRQTETQQVISPQDYDNLGQKIEAWERVNRSGSGIRLSPRDTQIARQALHDALRFSIVRPQWFSLKRRVARAFRAMRGKKGRAAADAFARKMGAVQAGGRRPPDLTRDEAEFVVLKYWELISPPRHLMLYVDDSSLWASGFMEQAQSRPLASRIQPISDPIEHPEPIVQAPVPLVEAVRIIAGWFPRRFRGNLQSVREFLERERTWLRKERERLESSSDPADQERLASMPASDFQIPGVATIDKLRDR